MIVRKIVYALSGCWLIFSVCWAQKVEIKGRVTERSSLEPLESAIVKIKEAKINTVTDVNGYYSVVLERHGVYTITASYIGYKEESVRLDAKGVHTIDFQL